MLFSASVFSQVTPTEPKPAEEPKGFSTGKVEITKPVQVNAVFAIFPEGVAEVLQKEFPFYVWNEFINEVRLMCSFDTTQDDIDFFVKRVNELVSE